MNKCKGCSYRSECVTLATKCPWPEEKINKMQVAILVIMLVLLAMEVTGWKI